MAAAVSTAQAPVLGPRARPTRSSSSCAGGGGLRLRCCCAAAARSTLCARRLPPLPRPTTTSSRLHQLHQLQQQQHRHTVATAAAAAPAAAATTLAVLTGCSALAALAEEHTRWGSLLSAPLVALLAALAASCVGLLPAASPVYDAVWGHAMPLAVALLLLDHDLAAMAAAAGPVLRAFLLGTATMLAGAGVAWWVCSPSLAAAAGSVAAAAKLAACLAASYVGGSVNFVAVAAATQLPAALVPGAMAVDNLGMAAALSCLMAVPVRLAQQLRLRRQHQQQRPGGWRSGVGGVGGSSSKAGPAPAAAAPASVLAAPSGPLGLDGSPLLTEPPSLLETAACMEATAAGKQVTRTSMDSGSSSSGSWDEPPSPLSTTDGSSASGGGASDALDAPAAAATCGGCRASGVTALDDHPLLTTAPGMGDAIDTIAASRQGKPRLMTPPKPPTAGNWQSKVQQRAGGGSSSSGRTNGSSGASISCGACSEALDAISSATPAPSFERPPSRNSNRFGTTSSGPRRGGSSSAGPLALDGSPLLTEEPDVERLTVAVQTARSGAASSSVTVTPLSSGEFELLVAVDKESLGARLREQQKQLELQQQQQPGAAAAAAAASSAVQQQKRKPRIVQVEAPVGGTSPVRSGGRYSRERRRAASSGSGALGGGGSALTASSGAAALAAAAAAVAVSQSLAAAWGVPELHQLILVAASLAISSLASAASRMLLQRGRAQPAAAAASLFGGAAQLGQLLMGVFFAMLGAAACVRGVSLAHCLPLLGFIGLMTATHWALLAGVGGRLLGLPAPVLLCGSAAAVGGPATAASLAAARGWDVLVQPSLLCGSLGYALGTGAGLGMARALGVL